jgi:hypothetical protein
MKKMLIAVAAASTLALAACGGSEEANNAGTEDLNAVTDLGTENLEAVDLNATADLNATDLNAADANASADLNAAADANATAEAGNEAANAQ